MDGSDDDPRRGKRVNPRVNATRHAQKARLPPSSPSLREYMLTPRPLRASLAGSDSAHEAHAHPVYRYCWKTKMELLPHAAVCAPHTVCAAGLDASNRCLESMPRIDASARALDWVCRRFDSVLD